jgi:hypothetical protein
VLGRHVAAGPGAARDRSRRALAIDGDAEVEQLDPAIAAQKHIARGQVAMHDAALVGMRERAQQCIEDRDGPLDRDRTAARQVLGEGLALQELEHGIRHAMVTTDVVKQNDVGVR